MVKDYYRVLESQPTSTDDEIKKNYFRLAKLCHPDVNDNDPDKKKIFQLINEAYSVLSDKKKRSEYNETLRKQKVSSSDTAAIKEKDLKSASLAFVQAKEAMRSGNYEKATLLLKSALKFIPGNPSYQSWYGFCLAMTNSNLHEARDYCKKAIQMEFYNADYHANLGFVYFKAGLKNQAVKYFRDALKWDPQNPIAKKFLSKLSDSGEVETGPITKAFSAFKNIFSHS
ncbi:MAG: DnaJ domain-containing protein [Candidatus Krumholzibacteriota bacterium]|nr:DnaJ domain-containing protein [Candidatus Krumholzibacteriota bacterium]